METTPLPASALTALTFLAGHWRNEGGSFVIEEIWLPPSAGVAQGMVLLIQDGQVGTIELIVAASENDRVVLRYNHFHSNYQIWENDGPIALTLTSAREGEIVFSNLQRRPGMQWRWLSADRRARAPLVGDADTARRLDRPRRL